MSHASEEHVVVEQPSRAEVRDRSIVRSLFAGAGLQLAIALSTLTALPFLARSLSAVEFGVFSTLTGFAALLSFADLGVGGSLTTRLAHVRAQDSSDRGRAVVSTALVASGAIGLLVFVVLAVSAAFAPWPEVLGAHGLREQDVRLAVVAAAAATGAAVPASIGQRILYGIGRGSTANVHLAVASLVGTSVLIAGTAADWPLYAFVLTAVGAPALSGLFSGVVAVRRYARELCPSRRAVSRCEWRSLRRATGWHLTIAVAGAVSFQTDLLVVSAVLGAAVAGVFAVSQRAFGLVVQAITPALMQLWPAFGDAYVRGDRDWVRSRLVIATCGSGAIAAFAGLVGVLWGQQIIGGLLTADLVPERELLVALAMWTTYSVMSAPTFMLLNATGYVHVHAVAAVAVAVVNLPLSIALTRVIGASGPAWGSLISSVLCSAPFGIYGVRKVLSSLNAS